MSEVIVLGDTHANWPSTKAILNRKLRQSQNMFVTTILQVGDFGYWPRQSEWHLSLGEFLAERNVTMHFADGNHEDHEALNALHAESGGLDQVAIDPDTQRIWHWRRGSVMALEDDINVMFFGGAASVDRAQRTPGKDWFSEEIPNRLDYEYAAANVEEKGRPDFVVAHDTPHFAPPIYDRHQRPEWPEVDIQTSKQVRAQLTTLFDILKPAGWFAGHHHDRMSQIMHGCMFEVLACDGMPFDRWAATFDLREMKRKMR